MNKTKKRCSEIGCIGFKMAGDERCLSHVRQKYASYWYRPISSNKGTRKLKYALDSTDEGSV